MKEYVMCNDHTVNHYGDKFQVQAVRLNSGGYDPMGGYWGFIACYYLYRYSNDECTVDGYVRAVDHDEAKAKVARLHPGAKFYN
jgi:hypothetical protein